MRSSKATPDCIADKTHAVSRHGFVAVVVAEAVVGVVGIGGVVVRSGVFTAISWSMMRSPLYLWQ